jgi:hypothetical protein
LVRRQSRDLTDDSQLTRALGEVENTFDGRISSQVSSARIRIGHCKSNVRQIKRCTYSQTGPLAKVFGQDFEFEIENFHFLFILLMSTTAISIRSVFALSNTAIPIIESCLHGDELLINATLRVFFIYL